MAASSLVSEGFTQRGAMSLRELDAALELWLAVAWLWGFAPSTTGGSGCGDGVGAGEGVAPLSGVARLEAEGGLRGSEGISPDPLERASLLSDLCCRACFSRESLRERLGGRLSFWRSWVGLGALAGSAGWAWL